MVLMSQSNNSRVTTFTFASCLACHAHGLPPCSADERFATSAAVRNRDCLIAQICCVAACITQQLGKRRMFYLANTFAGYSHTSANLFKRHPSWMFIHRLLSRWVLFPFEV